MITSDDCLKRFGDPTKETSMILYDVPTKLEIGVIPKRVYCNKLLVAPLEKAFETLINTKAVNELKTYDGCFALRNKKGGNSWSLHAFGLAIDVNASWNQMGKAPTLSPLFVSCFKTAGFEWGGDWKIPDGMHFQLKCFSDAKDSDISENIAIGSLWKHTGGNVYRVLNLANYSTQVPDSDYQKTVVYENVDNKTVWSRHLSRWFGSMQRIS